MIREASAMTVRNNLGELLNEVSCRHDSIVIQKNGKPVAAIVDIALFEKIRMMQNEFDALCDKMAAQAKGAAPNTLQDELQTALRTVRSRTC